MKNLSVIGIGKLGLCFCLTLEKAGYDVVGCDINEQYVDKINSKNFNSDEQGVSEALAESVNFRATTSLKQAIGHSDVIFTVVATPSLENGRYDHSQVDSVVSEIIKFGRQRREKHLIICCTTMPQYCDTVQQRLRDYNYTVSYNPEFIAQGTILRDQAYPDMVLIGEGSRKAGDILEEIYNAHTHSDPTICRMTRTEAEICKISLNCFLTTKIAFANMIGDIAKFANCDQDKILHAIGSDSRVGLKYLRYGFGYGGPCFPRDNRALAIFAKDLGVDALISVASDESNKKHLEYQIEQFKSKAYNCQGTPDNPIVMETVTYKPESTMLVESQQLAYAVGLAETGFSVTVRERASVIEELKGIYGDLFVYQEIP